MSHDALELLKERCMVIDIVEDQMNRLETDWDFLLRCLKSENISFNYKFCSKYYDGLVI